MSISTSILGEWVFDLPRTLIDLVQEGLPYYIINPTLNKLVPVASEGASDAGDTFSPSFVISEVMLWLTPTLVAVALLVLISFSICIGACCFACCRLKGRCGSKKHQRLLSLHNFKFSVCLIINVACIFVLLLGILIGFVSNSQMSSSLREFPDSLLAALQDGFDYANDTINEVAFAVTDQFMEAVSSANSDLKNIETELAAPVLNRLRPFYRLVLSNATRLLDELENTSYEVASINGSITQLEDEFLLLNSTLAMLSDTLDVFSTMCSVLGCESAVPDVPMISSIDGIIDPVDTMSILADVGINTTREHLSNSTQIFNNISSHFANQTSDFELPSNNSFTSTVEAFQDIVNRENEDSAYSSLSGTISMLNGYVDQYEMYRFIAGIVLNGIFAALALPFIIGVVVGTMGCRAGRQPYRRSSLSHCGGLAILSGIAACFALIGILLLVTIPIYFLGTLFQKICNDMAPPEYAFLASTADNQTVWGGTTLLGSLLASRLNASANLTVTGTLDRCDQDEPLYRALQLDTVINISEYLAQLGLGSITEGDMIDMLNVNFLADVTVDEILPEAIRRSIEDIPETIDRGDMEVLNQTVLDRSLEELASDLTDLAEIFLLMPNMTQNALLVIDTRDNLVGMQLNSSLQVIQEMKEELRRSLTNVDNSLENAMMQAGDFIALFYLFHNETALVLEEEIRAFVEQLGGYLSAYTNYLAETVENDLGRCQPVTELYRNLYSSVCVDVLDGINGMWFGVVWCVCACGALIMAGTGMAIFFRRATYRGDSTEIVFDRSQSTPHRPPPRIVAPCPPTPTSHPAVGYPGGHPSPLFMPPGSPMLFSHHPIGYPPHFYMSPGPPNPTSHLVMGSPDRRPAMVVLPGSAISYLTPSPSADPQALRAVQSTYF